MMSFIPLKAVAMLEHSHAVREVQDSDSALQGFVGWMPVSSRTGAAHVTLNTRCTSVRPNRYSRQRSGIGLAALGWSPVKRLEWRKMLPRLGASCVHDVGNDP